MDRPTGSTKLPTGARNFHAGETRLQAESGVDTTALDNGVTEAFDPRMGPGEQRFVRDRTFSVAASVDLDGRPRATPLLGPAGEVFEVQDETTVSISPRLVPGDELVDDVARTGELGILFLDPSRRRRAKSLGRGEVEQDGTITYQLTRFYGLCPRYIFRRDHEASPATGTSNARSNDQPIAREARTSRALADEDAAVVAVADTVFLASHSDEHGVDPTHRGGPAGFVTVVDDRTLRLPDYLGNGMYQTLGNLLLDPRIALMTMDLVTGRTVSVTGRGSILLPRPGDEHAERVLQVDVDEVRTTWRDPGRWTDVEAFDMRAARRNPATPMLPDARLPMSAHAAEDEPACG
ncbi:MAG TPA: pyridoxamine 5'-phosphate oxidase family protein [Nitriliruptoraceae bacterium]|nr:pyridoxamine 5'-phosphate oxidase family protein [Nitriliruptoraceae bacterium]